MMISIHNITTLEDLKEQQADLTNQLTLLKLNKVEQFHDAAVKLLRGIQEHLEQTELDVKEKNDKLHKGFVANYKNGYLRGEVAFESNSITILYDGEVIETIEVLPRPVHTFYTHGINMKEDILSEKIRDIEAKNRKITDEIKALEGHEIIYKTKQNKPLTSTKEVIEYLFK